jgi:predicted regulator of Ras-like GTPase activity (Roadblock/LC7/MglB family)
LKRNSSADETETGFTDAVAITASADCEDSAFASLGESLAEIRKLDGVIGYILRGNASAMLDLAELDKISDYAALTYQLNESSFEISKQLNVAEVESVLVEGGNLKVLFMRIGENKISVFMEKSASHSEIIKRILTWEI